MCSSTYLCKDHNGDLPPPPRGIPSFQECFEEVAARQKSKEASTDKQGGVKEVAAASTRATTRVSKDATPQPPQEPPAEPPRTEPQQHPPETPTQPQQEPPHEAVVEDLEEASHTAQGSGFKVKVKVPVKVKVADSSLLQDNRAKGMLAQVPLHLNISEFEVVAAAKHTPTLFLQRLGLQPVEYEGGVLYDGKLEFPSDFADHRCKPNKEVQAWLFGRALTTRGGNKQNEDDSLVLAGVWVKRRVMHMAWMVHLPSQEIIKGSTSGHTSLLTDAGKLRSVTHQGSTVSSLLERRQKVLAGV